VQRSVVGLRARLAAVLAGTAAIAVTVVTVGDLYRVVASSVTWAAVAAIGTAVTLEGPPRR
jgi:hypothetical protein